MTMGLCLETICDLLQHGSQKYFRQATSGQKKVAVAGGVMGESATRQSSQCWLHSTNGFTSTCTLTHNVMRKDTMECYIAALLVAAGVGGDQQWVTMYVHVACRALICFTIVTVLDLHATLVPEQ